jgi:3-hexulose-6-phosphate synthase
MKLQLAIDRVSIEKAIEIIKETACYIDIIEIGTSLIKDFGLEAVRKIKQEFPNKVILADIKTMDEAEYEFEAVYKAGADIATVLGAASLETIEICQRVAQKYKKEYMIDLLETLPEKQALLKPFSDGILCIHLPSDKGSDLLEPLIHSTIAQLTDFPRLAVAGGVNLKNIDTIKKGNFEIAIIGGSITKSENRKEAARTFKMLIEGVK